MNDKEKIIVGLLGLIVSIAVFILIMFKATDFSQITVKLKSNEMLSYLHDKQYEKFYDKFLFNNGYKLDQLIEYQKNVDKSLGNIKKYKYIMTTKNQINKEDTLSIDYDVNFSKFPNEPIRMKLLFVRNDSIWEVLEYKITCDKASKVYELINNLNYINSSMNTEEIKKIDEAKKIANQIIQFYQEKDYKHIYSIASSKLKEKGNEDEFVQYLKSQENNYENVNNIKFDGYEISRDKSECKFNYVNDDNKKNITIWVTVNENSCLSGINFH